MTLGNEANQSVISVLKDRVVSKDEPAELSGFDSYRIPVYLIEYRMKAIKARGFYMTKGF